MRIAGSPIAVGVLGAALAGSHVPAAVACAVPLCVASLFIAVRRPSMKELTRAGWALIGASSLTAALLVATLITHLW